MGRDGAQSPRRLRPGLGPRATTYSSSSGPQVCGDVVMTGAQMSDAPQKKEQPPGNVQAFARWKRFSLSSEFYGKRELEFKTNQTRRRR